MNLGEKITSLRKKSGMTQEELANELNVSRQTISKWELSQSNPELIHIAKLSDIFDVTTDYLIKDTETTNQKTTENLPINSETTYINTIISTSPKISPRQIVGIVLSFCSGFLTIISSILYSENRNWEIGIIFGFILFIVGLELSLIKNNLKLKIAWTIWFLLGFNFITYIDYYLINPYFLSTTHGFFTLLSVITLIILIKITSKKFKIEKKLSIKSFLLQQIKKQSHQMRLFLYTFTILYTFILSQLPLLPTAMLYFLLSISPTLHRMVPK